MKKLAICGGKPVRNIPFTQWPQYDENERSAVLGVLESRVWWRTPGTQTLNFEKEFADYIDTKHAIAVTNGTAALEVAMAALDVGPGDEVIVPDHTFYATASAVLFAGAMPVMVDVTPDTYCIDPDRVQTAITARTKAVIAVHIAGHPANLDQLKKICREHHLFLVEDCSHAHGSEWRSKKVGPIGDVGTFSFQESKLMTAGEGGIVVTNNEEIGIRARSVHDCGRMPNQWAYSHFIYGSNYRLSEWQGAILRKQLSRLDEQAKVRTENADYLNKILSSVKGISPQKMDANVTRHGRYIYAFHYQANAFENLPIKKFVEAINAEGIPTVQVYPPIHSLEVFQSGQFKRRLSPAHASEEFSFLKSSFPNSLSAGYETVWLHHPLFLGTKKDMDDIGEAITKVQNHCHELV